MKYVIDASIEIKTFVSEAESAKAIRLRDEYHQGIHELLAPDLFPTEVCNVLMILERSGKIGPGDAVRFFKSFLHVAPPLRDALPLLPRALEIVQQHRQTVYDSLYAALAEQEGCEYVTADEKFVKTVQPDLSFMIALSSLP